MDYFLVFLLGVGVGVTWMHHAHMKNFEQQRKL